MCLTRLPDESIMVGDIEIKILKVRGDRVFVGVSAPREVPVHRREVYDEIHAATERQKQ